MWRPKRVSLQLEFTHLFLAVAVALSLYTYIYNTHIYIYIYYIIYMYRILRFLGLTFWHPVAKWPLVTCAAKRERLLAERESEKTEFISDRHS